VTHWWKQSLAGDIAWCRFPNELQRKPADKSRPALVLAVDDDQAPEYDVLVAYGTSQKVTALYAAEFAITGVDGEAFRAAGLSYDTKLNSPGA